MATDEAQVDELPDEAVVVRGGFMGIGSLQRSAQVHADRRGGVYAWSFWCAVGKTADEIALEAKFDNDHIRESTIGRMRDAEFDPYSDSEQSDHCTVVLDGPPTSDDCNRLRRAFSPARPRPTVEGE